MTVTLEGRRPLLAEVQALLTENSGGSPRRTVHGLDTARVHMMLAVVHRRAHVNVSSKEAYVSTVGGVRLTEPASDLAVALAIVSAHDDTPLPNGTIAFGEIGLAGEVRPVPGIGRRIREAARLGFKRALVPISPEDLGSLPSGIQVDQVANLQEAIMIRKSWKDHPSGRPDGLTAG